MIKVIFLNIRENLYYMLLCTMLKKTKDSELMLEHNRQDWETSWGTNFPMNGVNDSDLFKIAEQKLRTMKIGKNTIEHVNFRNE